MAQKAGQRGNGHQDGSPTRQRGNEPLAPRPYIIELVRSPPRTRGGLGRGDCPRPRHSRAPFVIPAHAGSGTGGRLCCWNYFSAGSLRLAQAPAMISAPYRILPAISKPVSWTTSENSISPTPTTIATSIPMGHLGLANCWTLNFLIVLIAKAEVRRVRLSI